MISAFGIDHGATVSKADVTNMDTFRADRAQRRKARANRAKASRKGGSASILPERMSTKKEIKQTKEALKPSSSPDSGLEVKHKLGRGPSRKGVGMALGAIAGGSLLVGAGKEVGHRSGRIGSRRKP